jgi:uncharacterized repeat protein (TIGR01451 family)
MTQRSQRGALRERSFLTETSLQEPLRQRCGKRPVKALLLLASMLAPCPALPQSTPMGAPQSSSNPSEAVVLNQPPQTSASEHAQNPATPAAEIGQSPGHGLIHIVPFGRANVIQSAAPVGAHLTYFGGPVVSNLHVAVVFWGPNVNTAITGAGGIDQFFTDITGSRFYDLLTEYSTAGVTSPSNVSTNQVINHGQFDGKFTINPSLCPGPAACSLTDAQIQAELQAQISNAHLPQPVSDGQGTIETLYMIYFPPGISISVGGLNSCVSGGFCAYHSNTPSATASLRIPYGVLPDFAPPSGCSMGCGAGSLFQNVTSVTSHEMAETVTDVQVGSASTTAPPLAWYDPDPVSNPLGEIGDICNGQDVQVVANNTLYMVQTLFSNLQNNCVSQPPIFEVSTPALAPQGIPVNVRLTVENSVDSSTVTTYLGTVHIASSDTLGVLPADYTFTGADSGVHNFLVTLNSLGSQTVAITDTHSSGFTGTATLNVSNIPDLAISKTHSGVFMLGQSGPAYTITVSNVGGGPTTGTVTMTDTVPAGLTATAISGTGWACGPITQVPLTCTRSDALPIATSYPVVSLTVNVAANAPLLVTNIASVAGGGETNTANDTASDPTVIAAPDLKITKQHNGPVNGNFFQGETGATYTINVMNVGTANSVGAVTVVDTLPPAGLTATAISGSGWNCTLQTLTCTRNDFALTPGSNYPFITLTVDVAQNAPSSVTNTATVSGGGDSNPNNNVAQDVTLIVPPPVPDLAISKSHSGIFIQGQVGATYSITVSNVGTGPTTSAVTVTDALPAGLAATSIGGTGWVCNLTTPLACTRADALSANSSYPTITVTVNVAVNAPASVTNSATVSGGGDTNPVNNTANDNTAIVPSVIDLRMSLRAGPSFSVGDTNDLVVFGVNNFGNAPSIGPMTVTTTVSTGLTVVSMSAQGWTCTVSTLSCTTSDPIAPGGGTSAGIDIGISVALNAPSRGDITVTVSGGGDNVPGNNSDSFDPTINGPVTINIFPPTASVPAGQTASIPLSVGLAQAAGSATFSCSGLPAQSTCTFNPPSVTLTSSSAVTLNIATTARSVSVPGGFRIRGPSPPTVLLLALAFLGMFAAAWKSRVKSGPRRLVFGFCLAGALALAAIAGCGGGSSPGSGSPPPPPVSGTPAGTYAVTVTGTTPIGAASSTLNLAVK